MRACTAVAAILATGAALALGNCAPPARDVPAPREGEPKVATIASAVEFTGIVTALEPIGRRPIAAISVDPDPRFVVVIQVETVVGSGAPISPGSDQAFAIHSPSRLFETGSPVGAHCRMSLTRSETEGRVLWRLARLNR
jgi:hypothetical protein